MTHYATDTIDNTNSIRRHKLGELTAEQVRQGSLKHKFPVQIDRNTTVYFRQKPTPKKIKEYKEKVLHIKLEE